MDPRELRQRRAGLIAEAHALLGEAPNGFNQEQENRWNALNTEIDELQTRAERFERQLELEAELRQAVSAPVSTGGQRPPNRVTGSGRFAASADDNQGRMGTRTLLSGRYGNGEPELFQFLIQPTYMRALENFFLSGIAGMSEVERRDLQADSDTAGGYTVLPQQFMNELIRLIDNQTVVRALARRIPVDGAQSLGAPALTTRAAVATWGTELAVASADATMAFGKRELFPHDLTIYIKVSQKLLQNARVPIEESVSRELAYSMGITEETAFLTGSGALQPLGVFTASANGISSGQDVSTGNTTTSINTDGLIEAKYKLKAPYWPRCTWIFHRDALKQIRKLKDGDGQYIWQQGIQSGQPDRIMDTPVLLSEYAPNTFTTGLYVGIIGDFSNYWIADAMDATTQRLNELLALTNQVGFIMRARVDGMPVLEEAFARVKLA